MPKIFSPDKKQMLYQLLKQNCIVLLKEGGYKSLNIRDLARKTGISAGTFYHFYSSKEDLILKIMRDCQDRLQEQFMECYQTKGGISRNDFIDLYNTFFMMDKDNILQYLSRDDLTSLLLRSDGTDSADTLKNMMMKNINLLIQPKETINLNAVINFTQLLNLCMENKDLLVKDELTNTMKKLVENIADELFEREI